MPGLSISIRTNVTDNLPDFSSARLNMEMGRAISAATTILYTGAYGNIPKRTGRTAGTIEHIVVGAGTSHVSGHVGSDDAVAAILEFGSGPHTIRPSAKKALWWPGIPHPIAFANHPGTQPYLWLTRAGPPAGDIAKVFLARAFANAFG